MMKPALVIGLLWLIFGGTHIGLATSSVRRRLVALLGEVGFRLSYGSIAASSFTLLVMYYAAHRSQGFPGPSLGELPSLRWALNGLVVAGVMLLSAAFSTYPHSPYDLFAGSRVRPPRGVERITRHPFFVGIALITLPHALLSTHLTGTIFSTGFALLALAGARHQDAKLLALRGDPYGRFLAATSMLPFGAILSGRQELSWRELPLGSIATGLVLAFVLRAFHDAMVSQLGVWLIGGVLGGAALITWQSFRRGRSGAAGRAAREGHHENPRPLAHEGSGKPGAGMPDREVGR